jgi:hypothetical protein
LRTCLSSKGKFHKIVETPLWLGSSGVFNSTQLYGVSGRLCHHLDFGEKVPLAWMSAAFLKCLPCVFGDNDVISTLSLINMRNYTPGPPLLNHTCIPERNTIFSQCIILIWCWILCA